MFYRYLIRISSLLSRWPLILEHQLCSFSFRCFTISSLASLRRRYGSSSRSDCRGKRDSAIYSHSKDEIRFRLRRLVGVLRPGDSDIGDFGGTGEVSVGNVQEILDVSLILMGRFLYLMKSPILVDDFAFIASLWSINFSPAVVSIIHLSSFLILFS